MLPTRPVTRPSVYALSPETPAETIALYILILTEHYFTDSKSHHIEEKRLKQLGLAHIKSYEELHRELIDSSIKELPCITTGGWSKYALNLHTAVEKEIIDFQEKIKTQRQLKSALTLLLKTTIAEIRSHRFYGKNSELAYEMEKILWDITPVNDRKAEAEPKLPETKAPLLPEDFYATVIQKAAEEVTLAKRAADRGVELAEEAGNDDYAPQQIGDGDHVIEVSDPTLLQLLANMTTAQKANAEIIEKMARAQKVLAFAEFELQQAKKDELESSTYQAIKKAEVEFMLANNVVERRNYVSYQTALKNLEKISLELNGNVKQPDEDGYIPSAQQKYTNAQLALESAGQKLAVTELALNGNGRDNPGAQNVYNDTRQVKDQAQEQFNNLHLVLHGNGKHYNDPQFMEGALYRHDGVAAKVELINRQIARLQAQLNGDGSDANPGLIQIYERAKYKKEQAVNKHTEENNKITYGRDNLLAQYQKAKQERSDIEEKLQNQDPELQKDLASLKAAYEDYDKKKKTYLEAQKALFTLENTKKKMLQDAEAPYRQKHLEFEIFLQEYQALRDFFDANENLRELTPVENELLREKYKAADDRTLATKMLITLNAMQQEFRTLMGECERLDLQFEEARRDIINSDINGRISEAEGAFVTAQQEFLGVIEQGGAKVAVEAAKAKVERLQNALEDKISGSQILKENNDLHAQYSDAKQKEAEFLTQIRAAEDNLVSRKKKIAEFESAEALAKEHKELAEKKLAEYQNKLREAQAELDDSQSSLQHIQTQFERAEAALRDADIALDTANFKLNGDHENKGVKTLADEAQSEFNAALQAELSANTALQSLQGAFAGATATLEGAKVAVRQKLDAIANAKRAHEESATSQKIRQAEVVLTEIQRQYADIEKAYSADVQPHLALASTLLHKRDWQAMLIRDSLLSESIRADKKIPAGTIAGICPSENIAIATMRRTEDTKLPLAIRGHDKWSADIKADPALRSVENRTTRKIRTPLASDGKRSFGSYFSYAEADDIRLLGKRPKGTLPNGKERFKSVAYPKNLLAADASDFGVKPIFTAHRNSLFTHTSESVQRKMQRDIYGELSLERRKPRGRHHRK